MSLQYRASFLEKLITLPHFKSYYSLRVNYLIL